MRHRIRPGVVALFVLFAAAAQAAEPLRWVRDGRPTAQAEQMMNALYQAEHHGLSPASYQSSLSPAELQLIARGAANPELVGRFDEELSQRVSRFVAHLRYGRVDPRDAGFDLPARPTGADTDALQRLAQSDDVAATLATLEPRPAPYRLLRQALADYRQLAREPSFAPLPALAGKSLRIGDAYPGAAKLRRKLSALGDLATAASASDADIIDAPLAQALERFQSRHGLAADGVLGRQTLDALNIPMQQRVRQIELSMERWRWLGALARPDIVVNVPHFMLYALPRPHRPDESLLEMPVIVGRTQDRTPIFTAQIEEVVFNPYWDVPPSILRKELLPKIRKNASYLERHHFEIVRGGGDDAAVQEPNAAAIDALAAGQLRLRQRPGPDNALGPVKFIMPNPYSIRLHGTSEPGLFQFPKRAFSHGCIRVSDPAALTEYVLANASGEWNAEAVETALCGTEPRRVRLNTPVRVVVFYATAAATTSRGVLFAPDVYGHDARLEKRLALTPSS